MGKILLITIGILLIAGTVWAEDVDEAQAYATCSLFIENKVTQFRGKRIPPGYKIEAPAKYRYEDEEGTHWLDWNFAAPIYLHDGAGRVRGEEGMTGAVCGVEKKTGKIKYLVVSARDVIK